MDVITILLLVTSSLPMFFLVWLLFFTDTDLSLAMCEKFRPRVSVFKGKVVWITGASIGLGEAMAYELAQNGAKLILSARNTVLLGNVKNKCLEMAGDKLNDGDILVLPFDLTDVDVHRAKVNEALDHFKQIDVLINNAGKAEFGPTEDTKIEMDKDIFEINLFSAMNLTKLVLKHFMKRGEGQIVGISSAAGKFGTPGLAAYTSSKHALHGYYDTIRNEYYKNNIHVTVVCPGFVDTGMAIDYLTTKKEKEGEVHIDITSPKGAMSTKRCAHLSLVAAANKCHEVWMSYQPNLLTMFGSQYCPSAYRNFSCRIYTEEAVSECTSGKHPSNILTWKPFFS